MAENHGHVPYGIANGFLQGRQDHQQRGFGQNVPAMPPVMNRPWNCFGGPRLPAFNNAPHRSGAGGGIAAQGNAAQVNGEQEDREIAEEVVPNGDVPARNVPPPGPPNYGQGQLSWAQMQEAYPYFQVYSDLMYYKEESEKTSRKLSAEKKNTKKLREQMQRWRTESNVLRSVAKR